MKTSLNQKLFDTISSRFMEVSKQLNETTETDLYSLIASILYDKPYESCLDLGENQELRYKVKTCLLPIVVECGGITLDDEE